MCFTLRMQSPLGSVHRLNHLLISPCKPESASGDELRQRNGAGVRRGVGAPLRLPESFSLAVVATVRRKGPRRILIPVGERALDFLHTGQTLLYAHWLRSQGAGRECWGR
jgi:virulence-associated protein VagC